MGFSVPPRLRLERWALTPPFHPYLVAVSSAGAVYFLWHFPLPGHYTERPSVSLACRPALRGIAPYGVRTFLPEPRLGAIPRPSRIMRNIGMKIRSSQQLNLKDLEIEFVEGSEPVRAPAGLPPIRQVRGFE